jgi:hypothetical protein
MYAGRYRRPLIRPEVGKDGIVLPEALYAEVRHSKVASGGKTSMNIPESDHPDNSGNVHAHRSTRSGTREDAFAKQFKYIFIHWNLPKNDCLVM